MQTIEIKKQIKADLESAWALVCQFESYPEFMPSINHVIVIERGDSENVTEWEVDLEGSILRWTERDIFNHDLKRIDFSQIKGDLKELCGFWQLVEIEPNILNVHLKICFDIGIPMLKDLLEPVAMDLLTENANLMLQSISRKIA